MGGGCFRSKPLATISPKFTYDAAAILLSHTGEMSAVSAINKNFGHYIIRWKIKNFILATCQDSFITKSPGFDIVMPEITNWQMEVETTSNSDDSVLIHLQRLDSGPEVVWANWRVAVTDSEKKSRGHIYECEYLFERNQRHTVDLQSLENVTDLLPPDEIDALLITCHIIVKPETNSKISRGTLSDGLLSLSHDLRRMFTRGKYYDLIIKIRGKIIRAHKSILLQRNAVWGKLIFFAQNSKTINLDLLNAEATESIIFYLYTGDLRYVLNNPSLALYHCIKYFDVKELNLIFNPKEIHMKTQITSKSVTFKWLISDFARRRKFCVRSKIFEKPGLDSTWRLLIHPFGVTDDDPRTISVTAETVTSQGFRVVYVEFALLNKLDRVITKVRIRGLAAAGEVIGIEDFYPRQNVLRHALKRGAVQIVFKIWCDQRCDQSSSVSSQHSDGDPEICLLTHYTALSGAMKDMMESPLYKDVTVKAKGAEIMAHKCILAARSKTFSELLDKSKDKIEVDIDGDTLKILINYIYYGILGHRDASVLSHLYKIAEKFCISSLKEDCCARLHSIP